MNLPEVSSSPHLNHLTLNKVIELIITQIWSTLVSQVMLLHTYVVMLA